MSIIHSSLLLGAGAAVGPVQIERSLRFNSSDSASLSRVSYAGSGTFSCWVKRCKLGTAQTIISGIAFNASDQLNSSTAVFRDPSAWMHVLVSTSGTYVNGTSVASGSAITPGIIGSGCDLYLAYIHFIDGQALTPSSFTEVSATTGQLVPKAYTGSFGTNGFWLKFSDNSAATATTLGNDYSGNSNNWTPNNLSVTAGAGNDSLVDTPTSYGTDTGAGGEVRGNYATWNPLDNGGVTLANGNLDISNGSSHKAVRGTIKFPATGKWYAEFLLSTFTSGVNACAFGIDYSGATTPSAWGSSGHIYLGGNSTTLIGDINGAQTAISTTSIVGSIFQIAYDADAQKVWVGRDNTWYNSTWGTTGNPATGANPTASNISGGFPAVTTYETSGSANFGQRAFAYTAPSGFKALCDTNLPSPVVAKPSTVMDVVLWTGNSTNNRPINGLGFSPDLVWIKNRSSGQAWNVLFDAVRGAGNQLSSNQTDAELATGSNLAGKIGSFDSSGFTLAAGSGVSPYLSVNETNSAYVGWAWDAGSSNSTNTQGSITSSVRANASAGFSVVTFTSPTGTGNFSAGHGLGVTPEFVIVKSRDAAGVWYVYHKSLATDHYLRLNGTDASATNGVQWGAGMTSSVLGLRASYSTVSGATTVAYAFAPVVGYSSMGSYVGNGSSDGPAVWLGFRPKWLLIKRTDSANDWYLQDSARDPYNPCPAGLFPNLSAAEDSSYRSAYPNDMLSNGFKLRTSNAGWNASGGTYLYIAFAESPFQYSRAR